MAKRPLALLAAFAMVLAVGCVAQPTPPGSQADPATSQSAPSEQPESPPPPVADDTIYSVRVDDYNELSFDAKGNPVQQDDADGPIKLTDAVTGQPYCITHTLVENTGEHNDYGEPILRRTSALWELDGTLLYDYGEYTYLPAFGDMLIRQEHREQHWVDIDMIPPDFYTELWNYKTGERVLKGVARLEPLNAEKTLFLARDIYGYLMGTVDGSGRVVKGFDDTVSDCYGTQVQGDIIITHNQPYNYTSGPSKEQEIRDTLRTLELVPVVTSSYMEIMTGPNDSRCIYFRNDDQAGKMVEQGIMDTQGNKLFDLPSDKNGYVKFFDGELLFFNQNDPHQVVLMDMKGQTLSKAYEQIEPVGVDSWNPKEQPALFAARQGSTVDILNRQGQVTATREVAGLNSLTDETPRYILYVDHRDGYGVLNYALETVLEPGKYRQILSYPRRNADDTGYKKELYVGWYNPRKTTAYGQRADYSMTRIDLLDSALNPIATDITEYGTVGPTGIAVVRGFWAGVIDWEGNWIGKTSIFHSASDELRQERY